MKAAPHKGPPPPHTGAGEGAGSAVCDVGRWHRVTGGRVDRGRPPSFLVRGTPVGTGSGALWGLEIVSPSKYLKTARPCCQL